MPLLDKLSGHARSLDVRNPADHVKYNRARLAFHEKDYQAVIDQISNKRFRDDLLELQTKVILLKAIYELQEFDLLDAWITQFYQAIRRKSRSYHYNNYKVFVRYLKRLGRLNLHSKKEVSAFKDKIEAESGLLEQAWFLEKLGEYT